jgi:outer membrane protein assembly factor BamB
MLIAVDSATGHERWRTTTAGSFSVSDVSRESIAGRGFPCDSTSVRMVAFDTNEGRQRWQRPKMREDNSFIRGGDALSGGSTRSGVVLSATDRRVVGIDGTTGDTQWSERTKSTAFVAMNSNTVVLAAAEGSYPSARAEVHGLDRASGKKLWSVKDSNLNGTAVALADATSVVAMFSSPDGRSVHTRVLDPRSGKTRWEIDGGEANPAGPVVVLSTASRETGDLTRRVFDARTGEELWSRASASSSFSLVTPVGERLAFVDDRGLTVVDARTGNELWTRPGRFRVAADARSVAVLEERGVTLLDVDTGTPQLPPISVPDRYEAVNALVLAGRTLYVGLGCVARD